MQFQQWSVTPEVDRVTKRIEHIALQTNRLGAQPLWNGYPNWKAGEGRLPSAVRSPRSYSRFYTMLTKLRKPQCVIEIGTAFGVSGMYWLAGLERNRHGQLYTFEPNLAWAQVAYKNLSQIGERFQLVVGTFETKLDGTLAPDESIDIAFIDAIHTSGFVQPQVELVLERCGTRSLLLLDDINFSQDMMAYWMQVAADPRFSSSAIIGDRVGALEVV